jgi:hypothetical protein
LFWIFFAPTSWRSFDQSPCLGLEKNGNGNFDHYYGFQGNFSNLLIRISGKIDNKIKKFLSFFGNLYFFDSIQELFHYFCEEFF